ncbi:hypothetical protein NDU88_011065 [Pleurodeles waltl]|uniref:Uncharacterized protein n=1 Tax=Pleurodeles waltl TaxID=8319 RepID=A0AAV7S4B3_PLEWA|nr:hypothetical protein NDU88_011065 [Pleurodeles waltl]
MDEHCTPNPLALRKVKSRRKKSQVPAFPPIRGNWFPAMAQASCCRWYGRSLGLTPHEGAVAPAIPGRGCPLWPFTRPSHLQHRPMQAARPRPMLEPRAPV